MKGKKEIIVGLVMVVSLALFYIGYNFLRGTSLFEKSRVYVGVYDRIDGLSVDNPVLLNGFKVGRVTEIALAPDYSGEILVNFSIDEKGLQIPEGSQAQIVSRDLLGSKGISLVIGEGENMLIAGDTIDTEIEQDIKDAVDERLKPLEGKISTLLSSVDSAVTIVQNILNKDARSSLSSSFESIQRSFKSFERVADNLDNLVEEEQERIGDIFANVESITSNIKNNNDKLNNILTNMNEVSDSLAQSELKATISSAKIALNQTAEIIDKINSGQGSMGLLVNDDSLYNNLNSAAHNLDRLFIDLNENPKRYVHFSIFGKSDKKKDE